MKARRELHASQPLEAPLSLARPCLVAALLAWGGCSDRLDPADVVGPSHGSGASGVVSVVHRAPDLLDGEGGGIAALFHPAPLGTLDAARCVVERASCFGAWPADLDLLQPLARGPELPVRDFLDAGHPIRLGDWELDVDAALAEVGILAYAAPLPVPYPSGGVGLSVGGELPAYEGLDDHELVRPLPTLSPDPEAVLQLGPGGTVHLGWAVPARPVEGERAYLVVSGAGGEALGTELTDDGYHALEVEGLGLGGELDWLVLSLGRAAETLVDAAGTDVRIRSATEQRIYAVYTDIDEERLGLEPADTCDEALAHPPTGPGRYVGDLDGYGGQLDPADGDGCGGLDAAGAEAVLAVEIPAGATLSAAVVRAPGDAVLYLLADCAGACLAAVDEVGVGEAERLVWSNPEVAAVTAYLVLDAREAPDGYAPFVLDLAIE